MQSLRMLRRSPGLAITAIVAMAMGIGFTTTMFAIVRGGTRDLPVPAPERLVAVAETAPTRGDSQLSVRAADFVRWSRTLPGVTLGAFRLTSFSLAGDDRLAEHLSGAEISVNGFDLAGIGIARGRGFTTDDGRPGAPPVAIISDELRRAWLGETAEAVGRTLRLDGVSRAIVGVAPPGVGFPLNARVWVPLPIGAETPATNREFDVFARLDASTSLARLNAALADDMRADAGRETTGDDVRGARAFPFTERETPPGVRMALDVLVGVVALALLIACANVANLLLARAAAVARDTAVRTALGASRRDLIREQLAESLLLASIATLIGLALASAGLKFFAVASADILEAYWVDFRIDYGVTAFAGGLGLIAALAAGLVPALRASRASIGSLLQDQARGATGLRIGRLSRLLVVAQLTLACGLLAVTAIFVRQAALIRAVPLPFPDRVLTAQLGVSAATLNDPVARRDLLVRLKDRLVAEPGLSHPAFVSVLPGRGTGSWSFSFGGSEPGAGDLRTEVMMVTPEFFELASAPARRGRLLTWQDDARAPWVAVVNESFVRRYSPDRDPIGRRLRLGQREFDVVGVVDDLQIQDVEDRQGDGFYLSMLQARPFAIRLMTETAGLPANAATGLRAAVQEVDPDLPAYELASLPDAVYADKQVLNAIATLFFAFGLGAIFLSAIGLYAILSFTVTTRAREFGVRLALGASRWDLARLILRRTSVELGWGLGLGLLLAVVLSRIVMATLDRSLAAGPDVFATIAVAISVGTGIAILRPLWRVLTLSPTRALREG